MSVRCFFFGHRLRVLKRLLWFDQCACLYCGKIGWSLRARGSHD